MFICETYLLTKLRAHTHPHTHTQHKYSGTAEREEMLRLFMKRYLTDPPSSSVGISGYFKGIKSQSDPVELDGISDGDIAEAAVDLQEKSSKLAFVDIGDAAGAALSS